MSFLDDLQNLQEGQRIEFKTSRSDLPVDLWETYSGFANAEGGEIVLGVHEVEPGQEAPTSNLMASATGRFTITGVEDPQHVIRQFWEIVRNPNKVSSDVLAPDDVQTRTVEGKQVVVINVPRARRTQKPVRIREKGAMVAYVRRGASDFRCSEEELRRMSYDASSEEDAGALEEFGLDALCSETIERYRRELEHARPGHPWAKESAVDMLFHLRAIDRGSDQELHPTSAGLLAFGHEYEILRRFASFHLDYREQDASDLRWVDRLDSMTGDWSGNLVDFYFQVSRRLDRALRQPFALAPDGMSHGRDTDVNDAVHEAVANALVHAYYGVPASVTVVLDPMRLTVSNSGTFLVSKEVAIEGGVSEARNPILMRIFSLVGVADRAGTGLHKIFSTWRRRFDAEPTLEELFLPDAVHLELPMASRGLPTWPGDLDTLDAPKGGKRSYRRVPYEDIVEFCRTNGETTASECARRFDLKAATAHYALRKLVDSGDLHRKPRGRGYVYYVE